MYIIITIYIICYVMCIHIAGQNENDLKLDVIKYLLNKL